MKSRSIVFVTVVASVLAFPVAGWPGQVDEPRSPGKEVAATLDATSDDGAVSVTLWADDTGRILGMLVTSHVTRDTTVLDREEVTRAPEDTILPAGRDGVPDNAQLELIGCGGSGCAYDVVVSGESIGTLLIGNNGDVEYMAK